MYHSLLAKLALVKVFAESEKCRAQQLQQGLAASENFQPAAAPGASESLMRILRAAMAGRLWHPLIRKLTPLSVADDDLQEMVPRAVHYCHLLQ